MAINVCLLLLSSFQATLGTACARISILLELNRLVRGTSVDGLCHLLRLQLGEKLIKNPSFDVSVFIVVLCDLKAGTNDTIEVTLVSVLNRFLAGQRVVTIFLFFPLSLSPIHSQPLPIPSVVPRA